jgi:hypothetical protein
MTTKTVFNYRSEIEAAQIDYLASLRDSSFFNLYGIKVEIRTPKIENNLDEYINYVDDEWNKLQSIVVPQFKEYRRILSMLGQTAESNYPLDILIPSALHLPQNSRIILNEYDSNENRIAREWRVLSTESKQISNSKTYARVAHCVPARANIYKTTKPCSVECYAEFFPLTDYKVLEDLDIISTNYVKVSISRKKDKIISDINAICRERWTIKLPSILY